MIINMTKPTIIKVEDDSFFKRGRMMQTSPLTVLLQADEHNTPINIDQGPITRGRAKKLQQEVNSLIAEIKFNISENVILPKCYTLVVLRYICERGGAAIHGEEAKKKKQVDQFGQGGSSKLGQVRTDQFG
jgi:hypothetical protein